MEKACYSVDPENLQNHAHQEVQIFMFTWIPVKLPTPSEVCTFKKPPSILRKSLKNQCVPFKLCNWRAGGKAQAKQ